MILGGLNPCQDGAIARRAKPDRAWVFYGEASLLGSIIVVPSFKNVQFVLMFYQNADTFKQMKRKSELSKNCCLENSQRSRPGCRAQKVEIAAAAGMRGANLAWGKVTCSKD